MVGAHGRSYDQGTSRTSTNCAPALRESWLDARLRLSTLRSCYIRLWDVVNRRSSNGSECRCKKGHSDENTSTTSPESSGYRHLPGARLWSGLAAGLAHVAGRPGPAITLGRRDS